MGMQRGSNALSDGVKDGPLKLSSTSWRICVLSRLWMLKA